MNQTIIKYALDAVTGSPVYINDASNGLSCNCICAECGKPMMAKQGDIREKHFCHVVESECAGGQETAIHKLAKQIIVESQEIAIPEGVLHYYDATQEVALLSIIPDVTVTSNESDVHFEVEVTNPVDIEKENVYRKNQLKSIKIDLSKVPYSVSPDELKENVLKHTDNKSIIFWEVPIIEPANTKSGCMVLVVIYTFLAAFGIGYVLKEEQSIDANCNPKYQDTLPFAVLNRFFEKPYSLINKNNYEP